MIASRPGRPHPPERAALLAGLVTVTLWGSAFVGIRDAGQTLSPGALALGRLLVALVVLGVAAIARREQLPATRDLPNIAGYGVLFLAGYSIALNAAERWVDAGTAAMLINTGPILITILAGIFLKEGFPPRLFAGCAVAFTGCVLIGLTGSRSGSGRGIALLILAALGYATAVIMQKPALARASPLAVTWLGCASATPGLPAIRTHARARTRSCRAGGHRLDRVPRPRADRPRLRNLGLRPAAQQRRPACRPHLPDSRRRDPARLGVAQSDPTVARGRWR
jgi:drug/metabolite transporter (DMT)-like permease